ncbi:SGNH/GDSL hydrolase family protein [Cellulomonas sp. zg-ZUI199]|uniref:SGNH/GDSL hydrolase family protein n=1 Tax=Cellulomonas wangleii TaxID=2816956 RepID=A0ABX8D8C8_9CELL|nr:SGNH/GDSL hydrolase family protein [Cellulomonas wangleii]MBO0926235.1 SGNH/GDSL hydrolase family protein [Cellulomonas wangleii]QVI62741.1 SGNH/GDSL hydrolase family protein [Cellulomonas wangleii]
MKRSLRTARSAVVALVAALAIVVPGAGAALAHPPRVVYDALGDSYASGYGVPPYAECGRSQGAYAVQLDGRQRLRLDDFVACAGATTTSLVSGGQLAALDAETDLVTLTIGGNDVGWSTAVVACLGGTDAQCTGAVAVVDARITGELPALLDTVYAQVAAAAPNARVVVTGYPRLFSPEHGPYLAASPAELTCLNAAADTLDTVIAAAATRAGFRFVDVRQRFEGHGANSPDPWILGPSDPGAFHPTIEGYEAYTAAVSSTLGRVKPGCGRHHREATPFTLAGQDARCRPPR